jgi:dienelactone hydrolase/predicted Ser/Thr protein kinase
VIGETISHYRVISEIGTGGMGVVYKAEDLRLGRFVALKFLPPQLMRDPDARQRLIAEARAASSLDHANVCTIYDVEELPDGRAFIAMAFLDGETLKTRLDRGPLSPVEAARLALQVAHGLARAHQAGIAHRDVKPANIMVTSDGEARLLDFGIAKFAGGGDLTKTGTTVGTIAYMAPEHVRGGAGDARADVWALGVVLYEMIAGKRPFTGADDYELLQAIIDKPVPALPPSALAGHDELGRIVSRALERDPQRRFANAGDMAHALEEFLQSQATTTTVAVPATRRGGSRAAILFGSIAVAVLATAGLWAWRSSDARTARNVTLPEALKLADLDRYGEAFVLGKAAERAIPTDPVLVSLWPRITRTTNVLSTPAGADVSFALIGGADTWHPLGRTPLENVQVPRGVFRWRFAKAGFETREIVRAAAPMGFIAALDDEVTLTPPGVIPQGMVLVSVPRPGLRLAITGFDFNIRIPAPDYLIDRAEVTNSEFKAFVDAGGYTKREYWTEPFVRDGQRIEWAAAMNLFRDRTGRPGPATWEGGAPPAGHDQYPVNGVSWYEAAAYAAFRGKRLPTIRHWSQAAGPELGDNVTRTSNFSGSGPLPATAYRGLGPYGTVDMAGNVKEWVWNDNDSGARYALGGAWNDPDYAYLYSDSRPPFDRSETNGFRCMKDAGQPAPATLFAAITPPARNYRTEKPVGDAIYRIYAEQYAYDHTPLEPRLEKTDDSSAQWRREIVSIAPAYGSERLTINLFLPKNVKAPFQTVLYFPGSSAIRTASSATLAPESWGFDFVLLSGRAVAFPIYKYTFERSDPSLTSSWPTATRAYTTWAQQLVTDARRTLDYLGSRSDLAGKEVAYYGVSWGARMAPLTIALDPRIRTGVLLMGGLGSSTPAPEADPFHFVPRVRVPILMVNGDEDFIFPVDTTQRPFFDGLGTPPSDKKHVLYPGGHEIFATKHTQLVQEVVAWLDKYLGRVQ